MPPGKKPKKTAMKERPKNRLHYLPVEGLDAFQDLFKGIPVGAITALLGAPGACKSTLGMQLLVEVCKSQQGNVLIFDTENSYHTYFELAAGLQARYEVPLNVVCVSATVKRVGDKKNARDEIVWELEDDVDDKAHNIFVVHAPDFVPLSVIHGRGSSMSIYDSGKFKSKMTKEGWIDDPEDYPITQFVSQMGIKAILYDSITNPLDEIPAVSENFPARADMTQSWMIQIQKVAAKFKLPVIAAFHESKNDTDTFAKGLKIEGGKGVAYNIKFCLYMLVRNEMGLLPKGVQKPRPLARGQRALFVVRHPGKKPWGKVRYVDIVETTDGSPAGLADADQVDHADAEEASETEA